MGVITIKPILIGKIMTVSEFNTPSAINQLVRVSTSIIGGEKVNSVNARDLHLFLEVGKDFSTWVKGRISEYNFREEIDFTLLPHFGEAQPCTFQPSSANKKEYALSLDMAKELSMVEKNEKGREARKYFIECEKRDRGNSAPQIKAPTVSKIAADIVAFGSIAEFFGITGNQARLSANKAVKKLHGVDCMEALEISGLISETQEQHFTPTILGKKIGLSAVNFNKALEANGMQICLRDHKNRIVWQATPKGMKYCMVIDTGKKHKESGSPVEQLKWSDSVLDLFDKMIAA